MLTVFNPKSRDMTSLKHHFLKNFPTDLAEALCEDAKLMLNKVCTVSFASISNSILGLSY